MWCHTSLSAATLTSPGTTYLLLIERRGCDLVGTWRRRRRVKPENFLSPRLLGALTFMGPCFLLWPEFSSSFSLYKFPLPTVSSPTGYEQSLDSHTACGLGFQNSPYISLSSCNYWLVIVSALVNVRFPRKGAARCGGFMSYMYKKSVAVYCPLTKPQQLWLRRTRVNLFLLSLFTS